MRALPAILVLAVVLAGCGAVPLGPDADEPEGPSLTVNGTDATTDITPRLRHRQAETLRSAGSYTYRANYTNPSTALNLTLRVEGNQARTHVVGRETNRTEFTNATGTYIRTVQGGETAYRFSTGTPNNTAFTVATVPYNATYERVGTGEIEGVEVTRYEADGAHANLSLGSFAAGDPARFNATLHVTDDGFVKRVSWRTVTAGGVSTYTATYSALGGTSVEKPGWVAQARSQPVAPQAIFGFERNGSALDVQHRGGDALDPEHVVVLVGNDTVAWNPADGDIVAGDTLTVSDVAANTTVRVVWTKRDATVVLGEHTVEG